MENKIALLKDKILKLKNDANTRLNLVKSVPENVRQESSLYICTGELAAIDIILNIIDEL